MDEEKEPHYVLGRSRVNAMDYDGAIRAFEEALEVNPHSAQAHYQLAMLYENQQSDPAAAIYHYQQYVKYDPQAENADLIAQRITSCKQKLAEDVYQLPSTPAAQQQLEKLVEENRRLHDQISQWQAYYTAQLAAAKTNFATPRNTYTAPAPATSPNPDDVTLSPATAGASTPGTTPAPGVSVSGRASYTPASAAHGTLPPVSALRTHKVSRGETLASIARNERISLASLEAANPSVNPRKLRAGQVLHLPVQ